MSEHNVQSDTSMEALKVTLLADGWTSLAGGLATFNRELGIHLSQDPKVEVSFLVPDGHCTDEDKKEAQSYGITVVGAKERPGFDSLDWLSAPPKDHKMDVVIGHGAKLGRQVQFIKDSDQFCNCQWVQVVHTAPEDLSRYKDYSDAISKGEKKHEVEVELCKLANLIVPVGPRLEEFYSSYLQRYERDIFPIVPGLFDREFGDLNQSPNENAEFRVLLCGRGDDEDFELKGYNIAAEAFADHRLQRKPYHLMFVGAPEGKQEELRQKLLQYGIAEDQLTVRKFVQSREKMKDLLCEVNLAIMPSRSEGFGLVALEALSARLPILVSSKSGFARALKNIPLGKSCTVDSDEPAKWAEAIEDVHGRYRVWLEEIELLRTSYDKKYSWRKQCEALVENMRRIVYGSSDVGVTEVPREEVISVATVSTGDPTSDAVQLKFQIQDLSDNQQEIVNEILEQQIQVYMRHNDLSTREGVGALLEFIKKAYNLALETVGLGCLEIVVQCSSLESLENLWSDYCSGHLDAVAERLLVTDDLKRKLGLETLRIKMTIEEENYLRCKIALREMSGVAGSAQSPSQETKPDEGEDAGGTWTSPDDQQDKENQTSWMITVEKAKASRSAVHKASISGEYEAVKMLLDSGEDVDKKDQFALTPLHLACSYGQESVARLLLERGANANAFDKPLQLNNYDKLYLLMSKWKLLRLFNPLCYVGNITSIEDLENQVKTNSEDLSKKIQGFNEDLATIETMIEDSKTVKFEDLPHLLDIHKNDYEEQLNAAGVRIIPRDHLTLQRKIALNRPYSGDVYRAQWTQQQNNKIDVVVRYDLGPGQKDLFIREARIMTGLHHEYIMKFYGAVVLGPYAHSVGLVVERFSRGNLEEFAVPSLFHAWLFASQLSSALEYLETRSLVHTSVVEPFVYISSPKKISLGGFMCCYLKEETDKAREPGYHRDLLLSAIHVTGHQSHRLDDLSGKGVVAMFSQLVTSMFRYLDSHLSRELFSGDKKVPLVCPRGITSLMDRCMAKDVEGRPPFQEIVQILAKEKPATYCFTTSHSSVEPCELSFEKGEKVWVISQDASRYHGMWLGQKEKRISGFFESTKAIKIDDDDDDDQVPFEIRARGIEAELAYRDALLEGKVKLCRARLLIIGQDRAGKTSLKKSLIGLPFNQNEPSTEVVEVNPLQFEVTVEKVVEWKAVNDGDKEHTRPEDRRVARLVAEHMSKKNKTEIKQVFPGEEKTLVEERVASEPTQRNGTSHALSQDVLPQHSSRQDSIPAPEDSVDGFQERVMQKPNIAMPKELTPLVTECLRNLGTPNDGNSARETVLDIWDFAGQHLYYATHPLFFSHRAVYLLVHNLTKNLHDLAEPSFKQGEHTEPKPLKNVSDETNLDMLLSWLVSIHCIRQPPLNDSLVEACKLNLRCLPPPVLLVGTHADRVSLDKMNEVESEIISSLKGKTYQEHVLPDFYNVDNTLSSDSPVIKNIQAKVQEILSSGLSSSADLPVKWFNFEKAVKNLSPGKFYLTLDEIRSLARQECFIENEKQLDAMLNYYHDLGVIVRFQDTVVIDTQWLINLFKKLITICPYREQDPVDRKLWDELDTTGVLDMQLINKVFEKNLHCNGSKSLQQDILDMMVRYGFVARFHAHQESNVESPNANSSKFKYFVPAQLSISACELWKLAPKDTDPHPLVFKFCDGFVPHGLFPQLVSRLIGRSSELECMKIPKLYRDGVRFFLGKRNEFDLILLCSKRSIKLALKCYGSAPPDTQQGTVFSLPVNARLLIEDELDKLCRQWHWLGNVRYEICVVCLACQRCSVKCPRHKSPCCSDLDCQHLLPISHVEPNTLMSCPEQVDDHSRFTLTGLYKWFPSTASEESPAENECTFAKVSEVKILDLAGDITCPKWKVIGRLLGLEDTVLNQIEMDKSNDVFEQCYEMLNVWKRNQKPDATCERLKEALSHKLVMKNDLVPRYCYLNK